MLPKASETIFSIDPSSMERSESQHHPGQKLSFAIRFNSFLESKVHARESRPTPTSSSISSLCHKVNQQLNRKLQLHPRDPDSKISHIMENFKTISTYVDIKDFITELRGELKERRGMPETRKMPLHLGDKNQSS